jgi:glycine cleavage system H protein
MDQIERLHFPEDRYYDPKEHLWVRIEDGRARIGIDELGRWAAGTISYVDFHRVGRRISRQGGAFGTLEANKFVGALRTPVRGVIVAVNEAVRNDPRLVNEDPYERGWFVVIEPTHLAEDLAALVRGEAQVGTYVRTKIAEYRSRGILPEEAGEVTVH